MENQVYKSESQWTGVQLFGSYIKWWLLTLVTFGIYGIFFLPVRMLQWFTKHTVFA